MTALSPSWLFHPIVSDESRPDRNAVGIDDRLPFVPGRKKPRVAILLHGIACTWHFMQKLGRDLAELRVTPRRKVYGKVLYIAFDWRRPVEENAASLLRHLSDLAEDVRSIDLYGYSSGGLISRAALELHPEQAAQLPVGGLFTLHTPHRGSPLAHIVNTGLPGLVSRFNTTAYYWSEPGVRDLAPGSEILNRLEKLPPPTGVRTVMVGGDYGTRLFAGLTLPAFLLAANDGVVSVSSQMDRGRRGPDRNPNAVRLLFPSHHFSIFRGMAGLENARNLETKPVVSFRDLVLGPDLAY